MVRKSAPAQRQKRIHDPGTRIRTANISYFQRISNAIGSALPHASAELT